MSLEIGRADDTIQRTEMIPTSNFTYLTSFILGEGLDCGQIRRCGIVRRLWGPKMRGVPVVIARSRSRSISENSDKGQGGLCIVVCLMS